MLIYGQTLSEVFRKIPLQYKAVIVVGCAFLIFMVCFLTYSVFRLVLRIDAPVFVEMNGVPNNILNMLDPSITSNRDEHQPMVVMAFSAQSNNNVMNVRLATNAGKACEKWSFKSVGMEGKSDTLIAPDGISNFRDGDWRIETPSIVYDPDDKGQEWKLFAYKYFWSPTDDFDAAIKIAKYYGIITYKYSDNIFSNKWSDEVWLFSPKEGYPPKPYQGLVSKHLNDLSQSLADVTSYSRPSVIYKDGIMLMSLSAFTDRNTPNRTILLSSSNHGRDWNYLGSPTGESDAPHINGAAVYKGANLIEFKNNIYLSAVFGDNQFRDKGTVMFLLTDAAKAAIKRDERGAPVVMSEYGHFSRESKVLNGGFAAYNKDCGKTGLIVSEQSEKTGLYRLIRTFKKPIE